MVAKIEQLYNLDSLKLYLSDMHLEQAPKYHRFPVSVIIDAVWRYHRFNDSYRDISEELAYRGIVVSHEAIRTCWKIHQKCYQSKISV